MVGIELLHKVTVTATLADVSTGILESFEAMPAPIVPVPKY